MITTVEKILSLNRKSSLEGYDRVREIIERVVEEGDDAIFKFSEKFDGIKPQYIRCPKEEIDDAYEQVDDSLIDALELARENIEKYHSLTSVEREIKLDFDGAVLGKRYIPLDSAGIYIPGGRASYPSTALMSGIPASLAGVKRIVACTPPDSSGKIKPLTLIACDIGGVDEIYAVGGAQAVAALAYGTESIKKVEKIVGPGNIYVTMAKQLVQKDIPVDMPAGPSEVLIIADEKANIDYVVLDAAAQLEHDPMAIAVVLCTTEEIANKVEKEVISIMEKRNGSSNLYIAVTDVERAIEISNWFAPEHLLMMFKDAEAYLDKVKHAGSVFVGEYSPVAAGDYASGTNHILPTSAYAKMYSGLCVETFLKHVTYQILEKDGLKRIGDAIIKLAKAEGLPMHAESVKKRLEGE